MNKESNFKTNEKLNIATRVGAFFKKVLSDFRGDTMIEILVAFTMLTICLGSLSGVLKVASEMVKMSTDSDVAQAQYDEESARIFSQDGAYDLDADGTVSYNFNNIFSMNVNTSQVEVDGKTLDVFSTKGESESSYIKSLRVEYNTVIPMENNSGNSTYTIDKAFLTAYLIKVDNNVQSKVDLTADEKRSLEIGVGTEGEQIGISVENNDTGDFILTYPVDVAEQTYTFTAKYIYNANVYKTSFTLTFGEVTGNVSKTVTLMADITDERSYLGYGISDDYSTSKQVTVSFEKDAYSNEITTDWDELIGENGDYNLFINIGYEFKGWKLVDENGTALKDSNNEDIVIYDSDNDNILELMETYIFETAKNVEEFYFMANVLDISEGAMLSTQLQNILQGKAYSVTGIEKIHNDFSHNEKHIERYTGSYTEAELKQDGFVRVDINYQDNNTSKKANLKNSDGVLLSSIYTTPIWMKYTPNDSTIWWYSKADKIYLPPISMSGSTYNGWGIFSEHGNLIDVNGLADWDVSYMPDLKYVFIRCYALSDVSGISDWNTASATAFNSAFTACSSLTDVTLNWNTSNIETINSAFENCPALEYAELNWNLRTLKSFNKIFNQCSNLLAATNNNKYEPNNAGILNVNKSIINEAFSGCKKLTSFQFLERIDVSSISGDGFKEMFKGWRNLTNIDGVKYWDVSNATSFYKMFSECDSLENLEGVEYWDVSNASIFEDMFSSCTSLTDIDGVLDGWKMANATTLKGMFYGCTALKNISITWKDTSNLTNMEGTVQGCSNLKTAELNMDLSNVNNFKVTFENCTNLVDIDNDYDYSENNHGALEWLSYDNQGKYTPFKGCTSLKSIGFFKHLDTQNITTFKSLFTGCTSLEDVSALKDWNTGKVNDLHEMFRNCNLTGDVELNWDLRNVKWSNGVFWNNANLTSISNNNPNNYTLNSDGTRTPLIVIPNEINNAFNGCSKLTNFGFFNYLDYYSSSINKNSFNGCTSLDADKVVDTLKTWRILDKVFNTGQSSLNYDGTFKDYSGNIYKLVDGATVKQ
ncbi:MAG: DUF285 domain-containing protein [Lachnospiraceae bacterium]|nr:DUF285 domain-containing protein [Lachnospiraceae bacterium]